MFFLVFFQFGTLNTHYFDLAIEGFLDSFIVFDLLLKVLVLLINGLFLLLDTGLGFHDLLIALHHITVMVALKLYKLFLCFQEFFLLKVLCL